MRCQLFLLAFSLTAGSCDTKKLGMAGASCTASSDCDGELQCVKLTCVDPASLRSADAAEPGVVQQPTKAEGRREAERKQQEELNARRDAEMQALMSELKSLQEEQNRLVQQKKAIDDQLGKVTDESERRRLLSEKALLDAQLEANERSGRGPRKKKSDDPLEGL